MFGFSKVEKALRVLQTEFQMERSEVLTPFLKLFTEGDANEYDAAFSYLIARARAVECSDAASEALIVSDLCLIDQLADRASAPAEMRQLAEAAASYRRQQMEQWYPTFESWLIRFKERCGEINPFLVVGDDGGSIVDFIVHDGLRRAYGDRVSPERLADQFAPTFHPDTFGR